MKRTAVREYERIVALRVVGPPRSRLNSIEPFAVGLPYVEGLTSYVCRVAASHALTPSDLLAWVSAETGLSRDTTKKIFRRRPESSNPGCRIAGIGRRAAMTAATLAEMTGQRGVRYTTMLAFADVLVHRAIGRAERAWCAACLEDWRRSRSIAYMPLQWELGAVRVCPRHWSPLSTICPGCGKGTIGFHPHMRVGECPWCFSWLGRPALPSLRREFAKDVAQAMIVGALLAASPDLDGTLRQSDFASGLNRIAVESVGGGRRAFAEALGSWREGMTVGWRNESRRPTLSQLADVSRILDVSPVALLRGQATVAPEIAARLKARIAGSRRYAKRPRPVALQVARERLEQILEASETPPTLNAIAAGLGCGHDFLYSHFDDLCDRIVNRRKLARANGDLTVKGVFSQRAADVVTDTDLRGFLAEDPPPTLKEIASRCGVDSGVLYRRHNALSRQLAARHRAHVKSRKSRIVLPILEFARLESPAPSMGDICRRVAGALGVHASQEAYSLFPDRCRAITLRYKEQTRERKCLEELVLEETVRAIVEQLQLDGGFPTLRQVMARMTSPPSASVVGPVLRRVSEANARPGAHARES